ncbi:hypothetical protein [Novosphingobium mangrovi (ex Hu et al. 2023)]|uniref:Lipoprotein n=1 Tax=Novosphingobium mangrovi (ex Hu et al. 2023) TaxID=2930094 RepID=A0ABT0AHG8_9SPHN|nr:hypothetical protein [Novosphingobium mangrovi (ex Hu et al. 2023)]MCJ1962618.1 hypothetical protein [Novosphingobium mangrovi (ex Hu et al. 2023)]
MNQSLVASPAAPSARLGFARKGVPVAALALALALAGCKGDAPPAGEPSATASAGASDALVADPEAFVQNYVEDELGGDLGVVHVDSAKMDLDGDGTEEVLAYASGAMMCGTGGCNLLVLKPEGDSFRIVGDLSVVQLPVGVLDSTTNGWRDLAVSVSGGGMAAGVRRVPFDGERYASNPTSAGVDEAAGMGTVLITPDDLNPPEDEDANAQP